MINVNENECKKVLIDSDFVKRKSKQLAKIMKELDMEGIYLFGGCEYENMASFEIGNNLDALHFEKIKMSDGIYVINKNGYIGEGTKREIEYAKSLNIPITYMEEI